MTARPVVDAEIVETTPAYEPLSDNFPVKINRQAHYAEKSHKRQKRLASAALWGGIGTAILLLYCAARASVGEPEFLAKLKPTHP